MPGIDQPEASGFLTQNLILFGQLLHEVGLGVSPGLTIDLIQALDHIDMRRRADVYHAMRTLYVHRREELPLFDRAFELFWRVPPKAPPLRHSVARRTRRRAPLIVPPPLKGDEPPPPSLNEPPPQEDQPPILEATLTFSTREVLRQKDFGDLTAAEIEAVKRLMSQLVWTLGQRRTRRKHPGRGPHLDLRRTLRDNLRFGGEIIEWAKRAPKFKPRPLVIVADISGSMERYTRLLLHFMYSLARGLDQPVEVFVFSTHLTRITRQLRYRSIDRALREVSGVVHDWSGGTRIGESLKTFNYDWARRVLGRGAITLLISDGWDRGDIDLLGEEISRLQRSSYRLIWLNPLLGSPEYEPLTQGMQAALPHIDDFLPVHNLASLEDLAEHLEKLGGRRSGRYYQGNRQTP
jgi:uncharacterized protein with von Willebrand factor type A (vWA) domain